MSSVVNVGIFFQDSVVYLYDGLAFFQEILVTRTTCDLDMTFYPFDFQTCYIILHIIEDSNLPLRVIPSFLPKNKSSSTVEHRTWTLMQKNVSSLGGQVEIMLKFKRHPLFILLNILMPVLIVAFLTPVVFILPKDSSDRVGFSITMFLALSVYMTIVCNQLPQSSKSLPLVSLLLFIWYILDSLIVTLVIMNKRIYETNDTKPMPFIFRQFVYISAVLFLHERRNRKGVFGSTDDRRISNNTNDTELGKGVNKHEETTHLNNEKGCNLWKEFSKCIDKWCFLLFYIVKIALLIVFFSVLISNSRL